MAEPPAPRWRRGRVCLALAAGAVLIGLAAALVGPPTYRLLDDQPRVRAWVANLGPWGPVASTLLLALQVLAAPLPGQAFAIANGYLYGFWAGTLYSLVGMLLGSLAAMVLARRFGRPLAERLVDPVRLARWDELAQRRGAGFFFLVFLVPFLPDDLVCFVVGLSPLPILPMLVLCALGRLPGVLFNSWLGAYSTNWPPAVWWSLLVALPPAAWLFWHYTSRSRSRSKRSAIKPTARSDM